MKGAAAVGGGGGGGLLTWLLWDARDDEVWVEERSLEISQSVSQSKCHGSGGSAKVLGLRGLPKNKNKLNICNSYTPAAY
jgi:hypothetical protein